jgi:predicted  nucleic acid-binding Zn-ribbon protein
MSEINNSTINNSTTISAFRDTEQANILETSNNPLKGNADIATIDSRIASATVSLEENKKHLAKLQASGRQNKAAIDAQEKVKRVISQLENYIQSQQSRFSTISQAVANAFKTTNDLKVSYSDQIKTLAQNGVPGVGAILLPEYKASVLGPVGSAWVTA